MKKSEKILKEQQKYFINKYNLEGTNVSSEKVDSKKTEKYCKNCS